MDCYYRFNNGESGADVYDRTSMFVGTLFREFISPDYENYENVVIVYLYKYMGHKTISETEYYLHFTDYNKQKIIKNIQYLNKKE